MNIIDFVQNWGEPINTGLHILSSIAIILGFYKAYQEFGRSAIVQAKELKQSQQANRLKRVEFTLSQHKRLFDDPTLWSILKKLDDNHPDLATYDYWDAKRKFLTFFEELQLLINSELMDRDVAHYMFGYYASIARDSSNFNVDLELTPAYWGLFLKFAAEADIYFENFNAGQLENLTF